jgi:hypothetical protein
MNGESRHSPDSCAGFTADLVDPDRPAIDALEGASIPIPAYIAGVEGSTTNATADAAVMPSETETQWDAASVLLTRRNCSRIESVCVKGWIAKSLMKGYVRPE